MALPSRPAPAAALALARARPGARRRAGRRRPDRARPGDVAADHRRRPVTARARARDARCRRTRSWRATRARNIHDDTWMTDAYQLRRAARPRARWRPRARCRPSLCGSLAFDTAGRIVSVCPSAGRAAAGARHRPRRRSTILATYDLPERARPAGHEGVPELHRRRLLLPRPARPHLERDQDEPPVRARRSRRRHARS